MRHKQVFIFALSLAVLLAQPATLLGQSRYRNVSYRDVSKDSFRFVENFRLDDLQRNHKDISYTEYLGQRLLTTARQAFHTSENARAPIESNLFSLDSTPLNGGIHLVYFYSYAAKNNWFQLSVPRGWQATADSNFVIFAPPESYNLYQGRPIFMRGTVVGKANLTSKSLAQSTKDYVGALLQRNPYLNAQSNYQIGRIGSSESLSLIIAGRSPLSGQVETLRVHTARLSNGKLFYVVNIIPDWETQNFDRIFAGIVNSIVLNE